MLCENEIETYQRLWGDVVRQAVKDIEGGSVAERHAALRWVFSPGTESLASFESVCEWLNIDASAARARLLRRRQIRTAYDSWRGA